MTLILSGTDGLSDIDGSAATPAIRGTDTNTGIFFPAADTIAFSEGGAEAMRIDSSGNLLVGTTTTGSPGISLTNNYNIGWTQSAGESIPNIFRQTSSAATVVANGYRYSGTANGFASSFSSSYAKCAISCGTAAGAITFYTDAAAAVAAGTDVTPTERARIDSSGNLLVGTTTQLNSYNVPGSIHSLTTDAKQLNLRNSNATAGRVWTLGQTSASEFIVYANGSTGVYLVWNGTSWTSSSDERLKTDLKPIDNATSKIMSLRAVTGRFKTDDKKVSRAFLIAQDVQAVFPEAVNVREDEDKTLGLQYTDTIPLLVAAIKEQQTLIQSLTARIEALEGK